MSATDVLPVTPIVTCMECGTAAVAPDWLIEDVPTIGGGLIAVRFCFGCRGLAAWPVPERRDDDSGDIDARLPDARELW